MFDVHVVGAGVAGGFISTLLAKDGYKVVISEEDSKIGHPKHCTGVLSVRALESTNVRSDKVILNKLYGSRIYGPDFKVSMHVYRKDIQAYVVDRPLLEQILVNRAIDLGAELRLEDRVKSLSDIKGDIVIGADGPRSTVAQLYGFPPIKSYVIGYQEIVKSPEIENDHNVDVFLSAKYFPGFFGWFVPIEDGKGIVGYAVSPGKGVDRVKVIRKILNTKGVFNYNTEERFGGLIPLSVRDKLVNGNVLLIGDAGGFAKSTTGGGVLFSTLSARAAVKAIKEENLNFYDRYVEDVRKELKFHRTLRGIYNIVPDIIMNIGLKIGRPLGVHQWLVAKGDMDYASRLFKFGKNS